MFFVELVRLEKTTFEKNYCEGKSYGKDLVKQQPILKIGNSMEKNKLYC